MVQALLVCPGPSPPHQTGGDGTGLARVAPPLDFHGYAIQIHGFEGKKAAGPLPCQVLFLARFLSSEVAQNTTEGQPLAFRGA